MYFLEENLRSYWLHESSINNIYFAIGTICFSFKKGYFSSDHIQKNKCEIKLFSRHFDPKHAHNCLEIKILDGIRLRDVALAEFCNLLTNNEFVIETDFYSEFERAILWVGNLSGKQVFLKITDIENIKYVFED